jgi:hypothetical protein
VNTRYLYLHIEIEKKMLFYSCTLHFPTFLFFSLLLSNTYLEKREKDRNNLSQISEKYKQENYLILKVGFAFYRREL